VSTRIGADGTGGFTLRTLRADGSEVTEADPVAGYLAPAGTSVRQVREAAGDEAAWFRALPEEDATDYEPDTAPVLGRLEAALTTAAPAGWHGLAVECEASGSRMEITAIVRMADGTVRLWSPPAMVSEWLHRLRMREYHPGRGVWGRARFELNHGTPAVWHTDSLTRPSLLSNEDDEEPTRALDLVPLFDDQDDAGLPTWYRPVLGTRERQAVAEYLEHAPLVLSARGLARDELTGAEHAVPMGFHTDGRFVWPSAAAYYLREHGVPPALPLVAHIRARRHRPPATVPTITMDRAVALAIGRPWDEAEVDAKAERALRTVESVIVEKRISPRHYSVFAEREGAWSLVRDGDRYRVQWSLEARTAVLFDDVRQAAAYLAGQLTTEALTQ
jgi:hypothetical protein